MNRTLILLLLVAGCSSNPAAREPTRARTRARAHPPPPPAARSAPEPRPGDGSANERPGASQGTTLLAWHDWRARTFGVVDLATKKPRELKQGPFTVYAGSPNRRFLLLWRPDRPWQGPTWLLDTSTAERRELPLPAGAHGVRVDDRGHRVLTLTGSGPYAIGVLNVARGRHTDLEISTDHTHQLSVSGDLQRVATVRWRSGVRVVAVYDRGAAREIFASSSVPGVHQASGPRLTADGKRLLFEAQPRKRAGSSYWEILERDLELGRTRTLPDTGIPGVRTKLEGMTADGTLLVINGLGTGGRFNDEQRVGLYDARADRFLPVELGRTARAGALSVTPDGRYLIGRWDAGSGHRLHAWDRTARTFVELPPEVSRANPVFTGY